MKIRLPQLHEILAGTSVCCGLVGAAGIVGTLETDGSIIGIITAAGILLIGILFWIWSAFESGRIRRK